MAGSSTEAYRGDQATDQAHARNSLNPLPCGGGSEFSKNRDRGDWE